MEEYLVCGYIPESVAEVLYSFYIIIKIIIPILLIIFGILDLGKVVVTGDDKASKGYVRRLISRFIAAIAIFLLPSMVRLCFNLVNTDDARIAVTCMDSVINLK